MTKVETGKNALPSIGAPGSGPGTAASPPGSPTIYMKRLLEVAAEFGVNTAKVLRDIRLSPEALEMSDMYYTVDQHIQSIASIKKYADVPGLGLRVGERISIADLGIMGYAMLSSQSFGNAIEVAMRFQRLTDPVLHIRQSVRGEDIALSIEPLVILGDAYEYDVEETIAIWARLLRDCIGPDACLTRACVTWSPPKYRSIYRDFIHCPVEFNQDANEIRFPAKFLDHPLAMANYQASRICAQECSALLKELSRGESIIDSVRRVMINTPGQFPDLNAVARALHMSPRNLRRRLTESGTSFRKVSEEVRMQLATQYLNDTNLPIEQVAFLIGYTEASNFHRAFKRHTGLTPNELRRQINV